MPKSQNSDEHLMGGVFQLRLFSGTLPILEMYCWLPELFMSVLSAHNEPEESKILEYWLW